MAKSVFKRSNLNLSSSFSKLFSKSDSGDVSGSGAQSARTRPERSVTFGSGVTTHRTRSLSREGINEYESEFQKLCQKFEETPFPDRAAAVDEVKVSEETDAAKRLDKLFVQDVLPELERSNRESSKSFKAKVTQRAKGMDFPSLHAPRQSSEVPPTTSLVANVDPLERGDEVCFIGPVAIEMDLDVKWRELGFVYAAGSISGTYIVDFLESGRREVEHLYLQKRIKDKTERDQARHQAALQAEVLWMTGVPAAELNASKMPTNNADVARSGDSIVSPNHNHIQAYIFEPGKMGIDFDEKGIVKKVDKDAQAHAMGIKPDAKIMKIALHGAGEEHPYSREAIANAETGTSGYTVTFLDDAHHDCPVCKVPVATKMRYEPKSRRERLDDSIKKHVELEELEHSQAPTCRWLGPHAVASSIWPSDCITKPEDRRYAWTERIATAAKKYECGIQTRVSNTEDAENGEEGAYEQSSPIERAKQRRNSSMQMLRKPEEFENASELENYLKDKLTLASYDRAWDLIHALSCPTDLERAALWRTSEQRRERREHEDKFRKDFIDAVGQKQVNEFLGLFRQLHFLQAIALKSQSLDDPVKAGIAYSRQSSQNIKRNPTKELAKAFVGIWQGTLPHETSQMFEITISEKMFGVSGQRTQQLAFEVSLSTKAGQMFGFQGGARKTGSLFFIEGWLTGDIGDKDVQVKLDGHDINTATLNLRANQDDRWTEDIIMRKATKHKISLGDNVKYIGEPYAFNDSHIKNGHAGIVVAIDVDSVAVQLDGIGRPAHMKASHLQFVEKVASSLRDRAMDLLQDRDRLTEKAGNYFASSEDNNTKYQPVSRMGAMNSFPLLLREEDPYARDSSAKQKNKLNGFDWVELNETIDTALINSLEARKCMQVEGRLWDLAQATMFELGIAYMATGDFTEALEPLRQAVYIAEQDEGRFKMEFANSCASLGQCHHRNALNVRSAKSHELSAEMILSNLIYTELAPDECNSIIRIITDTFSSALNIAEEEFKVCFHNYHHASHDTATVREAMTHVMILCGTPRDGAFDRPPLKKRRDGPQKGLKLSAAELQQICSDAFGQLYKSVLCTTSDTGKVRWIEALEDNAVEITCSCCFIHNIFLAEDELRRAAKYYHQALVVVDHLCPEKFSPQANEEEFLVSKDGSISAEALYASAQIGFIYTELQDWKSAKSMFERCVSILQYDRNSWKQFIKVLNPDQLAFILEEVGRSRLKDNHEKGEQLDLKSFELLHGEVRSARAVLVDNDIPGLIGLLCCVGGLYGLYGQLDTSIEWLLRAKTFADERKDAITLLEKGHRIVALFNLAIAYSRKKESKQASSYLAEAQQALVKIGADPNSLAWKDVHAAADAVKTSKLESLDRSTGAYFVLKPWGPDKFKPIQSQSYPSQSYLPCARKENAIKQEAEASSLGFFGMLVSPFHSGARDDPDATKP